MSQAAQLIEEATVPRLDELRVLRAMRTTGTKNHARYALATLALIRLHHRIGNGTRATLFAPIPGVKETKQIIAEGKAAAWQTAFLERLEEVGLLRNDHGVYSVPLDRRAEFSILAASPFFGNGLGLRKLLWPADYADDEPEPETAQTEHVEAPSAGGETELLSELTTTLSSLVQTMSATLATVAPLSENMAALEKRIGAKVDDVLRSVAEIREVADSFNETARRCDALAKLLEDEDRRKIAAIASAISENSGRARSVVNQFDAVVSKESDLLVQLNDLLGKRKP